VIEKRSTRRRFREGPIPVPASTSRERAATGAADKEITMLRLSSLTAFAASAVVLALTACGPATIASGGGGSTTTTTTETTTTSGTGGESSTCAVLGGTCVAITPDACAGGSWGDPTTCGTGVGVGCCIPGPVPNKCVQAGGTCEAITPEFCQGGTIGDATQYSCGSGVGVGCCFPAEPCGSDPCTTEGATRCSGALMQVCGYNPQTNCALEWLSQAACPDGQACNSDGTACVAPVTQCTQASECGCGCTCTPQGVCGFCTGAIPDSCTTDDECGPSCNGFHCVAGKCAAPVCVPGENESCNELLSMSSFAGTCNPDRTCTCKPGFTKQPDGKCAP
jgi:hypothetical protein